MAQGGDRGNQYTKVASHQNEDLPNRNRTKDYIARNFGVGGSTVERAEHYVDGLNAAEEISPGIKEAVLSGAVKAPKQVIAETHTETHTEAVKTHTGHYNKPQQETTGKPANTLRFNGYKLQTTTRRNKKN